MTGYIHSFQSLGALDGPGIRFVVFMQGCNLRCGCCHNPDTWDCSGGKEFTATEVFEKAKRYKEYFGKDGGITVSGGEPLLQSEFITELFELCKSEGINTCLDTSGSIMNNSIKKLLKMTDRVLLDVKYTNEEQYRRHVGCSYSGVLDFLKYLNENKIPVTLRQVIIPTLNDNKENINRLKEIINNNRCIDKTELLPFKKICQVKYDKLGIDFPFASIPEPSPDSVTNLNKMLNS